MATGDPTATLTDPVAQGQIFTPQTWADLSAKGNRLWAMLVGGTYTVKKLLVDGTGNQAASFGTGVIAKVTGGVLEVLGDGTDTGTAIQYSGTPSAHMEFLKFKIGGGTPVYGRLQIEPTDDAFGLTINALWNGTAWDRDDAAKSAAYRLKFRRGGTYGLALQYYTTAGTWAEGAWIDTFRVANADSSFYTKRLRSFGTTPTGSSFTVGAGWGTTGAVSVITGDDTAGCATVTAGGMTIAANPTLVYTFKDGTYTSAPNVEIVTSEWSGTSTPLPIKWVVTATAWTATFVGTPTSGDTQVIRWRVTGN